jgi:phospholipid/cholesterol/gamma-HCH transport system substrate-binding protein
MQVSKEYKLGLLVVIGAILVFVSLNLLKSGLNMGSSNEYYAVFDDATGLKEGNDVQLNGVKIGRVLEIKLHPKNPAFILAKFNLENTDIEVPASSEAWLISTDIVGTKCIDLRLDLSDTASAELLADGDTLNSRKELTLEQEFMAHLDPLKNKTEKLITRVENIIVEINELWDSSASYTFEESVYAARAAIGTYKQVVSNLTDMINRESQMATIIGGNIKIIKDSVMLKMNDINDVAANITAIKGDFIASDLISEMADLNVSMTQINALIIKIDNGEGSFGALTKTTEFKDAVKVTQSSIDELLANIQEDPMKYIGFSIFGKKIQGLKLTPEEEKILNDWLAR